MKVLQKINQCGSSSHFTIPRAVMFWLGWLPGQYLILEVLEDKSVRLRERTEDDFAPKHPARIVFDKHFPERP